MAASDVYAWNMLETQAYKPISMTDSSNLVETLQKECYYNKMINQNNKTLLVKLCPCKTNVKNGKCVFFLEYEC